MEFRSTRHERGNTCELTLLKPKHIQRWRWSWKYMSRNLRGHKLQVEATQHTASAITSTIITLHTKVNAPWEGYTRHLNEIGMESLRTTKRITSSSKLSGSSCLGEHNRHHYNGIRLGNKTNKVWSVGNRQVDVIGRQMSLKWTVEIEHVISEFDMILRAYLKLEQEMEEDYRQKELERKNKIITPGR